MGMDLFMETLNYNNVIDNFTVIPS
jgi:hypothetical protein